jgi:hypothetical protein
MRYVLLLVLAALATAGALATQGGGAAPAAAGSLTPVGTYASGLAFDGDYGAAEIPAYDPRTKRVFVVNAQKRQIDVLDISTPSAPAKVGSIPLGGVPNSVAVSRGVLAVAVEADPKTDPGAAVLYPASCDPADCEPLAEVGVGALPDMLAFTPNGRYLLVANESEPEDGVDPKGTVSVVDVRKGPGAPSVRTVDFTALDGKPVPPGAVLQSGKLPSEDFEPEYVAVSEDSKTAWVALQEANALAEIDVRRARLVAVRGLGFKDHGLPENSLDASDRDQAINLCAWKNVHGAYQPDGIASFRARGRDYVVSANEGDSRDGDEAPVGASALDPAFAGSPFTAELRASRNLGRLVVNKNLGLVDGRYEKLYAYGARSFAIWGADGRLVYDSGNDLERIVGSFAGEPAPSSLVLAGPAVPPAKTYRCPIPAGEALPAAPPATTPANSNHEEGPSFDNRSDNKGPEPEGVAVGTVDGRTYAYVGLERASGIVVYDVSDPAAPVFVQYVNPRDFSAAYALPGVPGEWEKAGDLGPEGLAFVPKRDSPSRRPLLVVANEVSGTTTIYEVRGG